MRKEQFTEQEWQTVREAPHWAAFAAMIAGASGVVSTLIEAFVVERALHQGAHHANALIRELSSRSEYHAVDAHIRAQILSLDTNEPADWVHATALRQAKEAKAILHRVSPEDWQDYAAWISAIAKRVANAAKEGSILGFGGTRIGEKEQQFLNELEEALRLP